MRVLVTGGTGFIGSHVVEAFLGEGHRVVALDAAPDADVVARLPRGAEVLPLDVTDRDGLDRILRERGPFDAVVHLAYVMGAESEADPVLAMRVNAYGSAVVLDAAGRAKVRRAVFLSSESVYGRSQARYGDRPVTEEDFCAPSDHVLNYSLTKLLNEHVAAKIEARYGIQCVSLRAPVVYGAGRKRGTTAWASDFATLPALGRPVTLPFAAADRNCYLYAGDLARQIVALCAKERLAHRIYNAGGETVIARELAAIVRRIRPGAEISFTEGAPPSPFIHRMDDARIRAEIGSLRRPMEEGIREHMERVRIADRAGAVNATIR